MDADQTTEFLKLLGPRARSVIERELALKKGDEIPAVETHDYPQIEGLTTEPEDLVLLERAALKRGRNLSWLLQKTDPDTTTAFEEAIKQLSLRCPKNLKLDQYQRARAKYINRLPLRSVKEVESWQSQWNILFTEALIDETNFIP